VLGAVPVPETFTASAVAALLMIVSIAELAPAAWGRSARRARSLRPQVVAFEYLPTTPANLSLLSLTERPRGQGPGPRVG